MVTVHTDAHCAQDLWTADRALLKIHLYTPFVLLFPFLRCLFLLYSLFGISSVCPFSLPFFHYSFFPPVFSSFLFSCFLHFFLHYIYPQSAFLSCVFLLRIYPSLHPHFLLHSHFFIFCFFLPLFFLIRVSFVLSFLLRFHFIRSSFSSLSLLLSPFPLSYIFFIPFLHSFPSSFSFPALCLRVVHLAYPYFFPFLLRAFLPHSLAT